MTSPTLWPRRGDTGVTAARKVAVVYRTHLHTANPTVCARIDDAMRDIGQRWVIPERVTVEMDALVLTAEAAAVAGVNVETVRQWRRRGYIDREGVRRYLSTRGLSESGAPMFSVGEVLEVVATTRSRRRAS